jgi:transcriptional regulator with XRE-family HTH domain
MPRYHPSLAGLVLKNYRKEHQLTQAQLAHALGIEARTLRMYENGERPLENIQDLRRIAIILGIEPKLFGLTPTTSDVCTPEQIEEVVDHTWSLISEACFIEARAMIETLLRDVGYHTANEDPLFLSSLARAYQAAGHVVSITSRTGEVGRALYHFQQMESLAHAVNDQTLLNIALTYQGELLRRRGDIALALTYLEAVRDTTPQADVVERGNALQLLGRAYLQAEDLKGFEYTLAEAEELAQTIQPVALTSRHSFSLGSVYDEYGKGYGRMGLLKKSLSYFDRAEAFLSTTKRWMLVLGAGRAETLIYCSEYKEGVELAVKVAKAAHIHGHLRVLERLMRARHYLDQRAAEISSLSRALSEVLDGPIDR